MRVEKLIIFCSLFLLLQNLPIAAEPLQAQVSSPTLTVEECLETAYEANPTLKAAMTAELVAEAGVIQAKTRVNPTYNILLAPAEQTYHLFELSNTWQMGNKRKFRIEIAKNQIESTNLGIRTLAWKIREDTAQAFFDLAIADKSLKLTQEYLDVANNLLRTATEKEKVGKVSYLDVSRTKAALSQTKIGIAVYEARLSQAKCKLNLMMGSDSTAPINIDLSPATVLKHDKYQLPNFSDLLAEARKNRLEYSQIEANLKVENSKIKLAKSSIWPDLIFGGGLSSVAVTRNSFLGENFSQAPELYFQIPIPIFNRQQGAKATSEATIKQLEAQKLAFTNQIEQELSLAYSNLESADKQLHIYLDEILPEQKEILDLSQKAYEQGLTDLTGAVTAQQAVFSSKINYLQALTNYFQALIDMERAIGKPISFDFSHIHLDKDF